MWKISSKILMESHGKDLLKPKWSWEKRPGWKSHTSRVQISPQSDSNPNTVIQVYRQIYKPKKGASRK